MFKRPLFLALFLVGFTATVPAWGQGPDASKKRPLPDFDARDLATPDRPAGGQQAQARALVERRRAGIESFLAAEIAANPGTRIVPNRFGVPKLFLRDGKSLSAPSTQEPEEIARTFLRAHTAVYPFAAAEADTLRLLVKDVTAGATYVAFNQTVGGVDVFEGQIKFTISRIGEVVQVAAGEVAPDLSLPTTPALSPEEAVRAAYAAIGLAAPAALARAPDANGKVAFLNPRGGRSSAITTELSVFPLTAVSARLAYRVFLDVDAETWYEMLIDAGDGSLLFRHNLYVSAGQARVWAQSPMVGSRDLVALPAGWLPADATVTTGNNTDAYLDADGNDVADTTADPNMQSGRAYSASQVFDFAFGDGTLGLDPRKYQPAAVTNLFYLINSAHDYYYGLGFTEAAGNFQTDNFGKGGAGNDAVLAEAQQPYETNNASFAPTPEGVAPRIRMGLFTRGTTSLTDDLDSDYDGEVVFHEYGHGVSNRLVGALTSTSCLNKIQSGGMGEGWSDYFSISFYNNPVEGAYLVQNTARGVRRYSYEGYPYTYEDIGNAGYEVHNDGEIWAATLWDLRKSLGPATTDLLVMNGLKSTPCHPSMTDARDAILSADVATNGGANQTVIWQVFAKHGMGYSALGVDGDDATGARYDAAYDQPPPALQTATNPAIASNPLSVATGLGDAYAYRVIASNPNGGVLNYALGAGPAGMTVDSGSGSISWIATFLGQRVKIVVTDGKGGKVVHGYYLPVSTRLGDGAPVVIGGSGGTAGYASVAVPANAPVLQVTMRGSAGDADLYITAPDGSFYYSGQYGDNETVTLANPKAGTWQIEVDGYSTYSGVSLTAAMVTPTLLSRNATVSGLSGVIGSETLYRVTIPAGAPLFSVSTSGGAGDVNLYLRKGQPAVCQVSPYVGEPCLYNSRSVNAGNADGISLINPAAADWYLDLSGYAAYSGVTLVTSTAPVSISTSSLVSGVVGIPYSQKIAVTGGLPFYLWSLTSGSLPGGLTLDGLGTISGTPTAAGSFSFTIQVTDATSSAATAPFTLTIAPAGSLAIATYSILPSGTTVGAYSFALAATGGTAPYTWSVASGSLPGGLTLSGAGTISGTPTASGASVFTAQVTDSVSATAAKAFTLTVFAGYLPGIIATVAGTGSSGYSGDGGQATDAELYGPYGVTLDGSGNLYIADAINHRVRMVSASGVITTVAGAGVQGYSGDGGPATSAQLNWPSGVALDSSGNVYIADEENNRVRKVSPSGIIGTVAGTGVGAFSGDGGPATGAQLTYPYGVAVDASDNLYIADWGNNRIRKVSVSGIITTVAGTGGAGYSGDGGPATSAQLDCPYSVALDGPGNLYIADECNSVIRKVSVSGIITTVAGNGVEGFSGDGGPATAAELAFPHGVILDGTGNLYIADSDNNRIRKVLSVGGSIATVAGNGVAGFSGDGGPAPFAALNWPHGVVLDSFGNLYIGDSDNNRVRFIGAVSVASLSIATTSPMPQGTTGTAYSQTLVATGGVSPYTWSVTSGALPGGLTLGASGIISGTPTTAGSFRFTVQVKDGAAATATIALALTIVSPPSPLSIATGSPLLSGFKNGAFYQVLFAAGGAPPYVWSLASGALPAGLALYSGGGITGLPTAPGTANFTVQVSDGNSSVVTKAFTLTVVAGGSLVRVGVLSQFAAGGSWDTTISLTNNSSSAVPVRLVFHGDDGAQVLKTSDGTTVTVPLTVTQQGDTQTPSLTTLDRVVNPNTTLVVAGGLGLIPNVEGWVDVLGNPALSGFAVFRYAPGGLATGAAGFVTPWEGTVPLQSQLSPSTLILPFDNTNGFTTGIAIGNLSTSAATITATFFDIDGNALGSPQTIPLQASGHTAFMVNPGPTNQDWSFTAGQQGIVKFTGAPMMGLGLRASPYGTLTSVPAVLQ